MPVARTYLEQLGLFQRNPDLLQAGAYKIRAETNLEVMGAFVARLYDANASISITDENAASLRELCREFGFSGLDNEFKEMDAGLDLPGAKREILRLRQRVDRQDAMIEELKRQLKAQDETFRESLRACERRFMDALEDDRAALEAKYPRQSDAIHVNLDLIRKCELAGEKDASIPAMHFSAMLAEVFTPSLHYPFRIPTIPACLAICALWSRSHVVQV